LDKSGQDVLEGELPQDHTVSDTVYLAESATHSLRPVEKNLAAHALRLMIGALKVGFGSQSDAGTYNRGILISVLHTVMKGKVSVVAHLKRCWTNSLTTSI
jgi:hypothetical protein